MQVRGYPSGMVTQNTVISFEQLVRDFDSMFQHRVFRLETLDYYDAPNETVPWAQFHAGQPADWAWREPWKRLVRDVRASGRVMERVHVVSEPISEYVRFEMLRVYPANVDAGEDVRIIDRWRAQVSGLIQYDFWLFDDDLAVLLEYDSVGGVCKVTKTADPILLPHLRDTRNEALRRSIPLARYVAKHNITEGKHAA